MIFQMLIVLKELKNGNNDETYLTYLIYFYRVSELLEKAPSGIILALCGNKSDLDERKVSYEVYIHIILQHIIRKLINTQMK